MKIAPLFCCLVFGFASSVGSAHCGTKPLTLKEARSLAVERHPKITIAQLHALVAEQTAREVRSGLLPNLSANLGAVVTADEGTRIASSNLPVSSVFNRASAALNLTQLLTDFGRSRNLSESSKLLANAAEESVDAARAQIILQVDGAYFAVLQAQAMLRVADETVNSRELLRNQVSALAKNKLKSQLDASFAEVNLEDARLGRLKADNLVHSSSFTLAALLNWDDAGAFTLAEESLPGPLPGSASKLVSTALDARPELLRLRMQKESALKLVKAEKALRRPSLSLQGTAGIVPYREDNLNQNYAAGGLMFNVPLFSGNLNEARGQAAVLRAQAAEAELNDEENNVKREVQIAWCNASNAQERLAVSASLLEQAQLSFSLADARYKAGTSSIVELSQAQLNLTSAKLTAAAARYEYFVCRSVLAFQTGQLK